MNYLDNLMYGFKEIAGAKINLLPHQMQVVMRCLSEVPMRFMLADEVGMGKTIEALSVLSVYLKNNTGKRILLLVPDSLKEQWHMEMLLKYGLEEGTDNRKNEIKLMSISEFSHARTRSNYSLVIVDEIHKMVADDQFYPRLYHLLTSSKECLLLSATPVRHRPREYFNLLRLLEPKLYGDMRLSAFEEILGKQKKVMGRVLSVNDSLEEMKSVIGDDETDPEEASEYTEEITDELEELDELIEDPKLKQLIEAIQKEDPLKAAPLVQRTIAYLAEGYQVEKRILKNRRQQLEKSEDQSFKLGIRHLSAISYSTDGRHNAQENEAYNELINWVETLNLDESALREAVYGLFQAFFSSSWAYEKALNLFSRRYRIPLPLSLTAKRWKDFDESVVENLNRTLDDPWAMPSYADNRLFHVFDFLNQEIEDEKAVVFINDPHTFAAYKSAFLQVYSPEEIAFFDCSKRDQLGTARIHSKPCRFGVYHPFS